MKFAIEVKKLKKSYSLTQAHHLKYFMYSLLTKKNSKPKKHLVLRGISFNLKKGETLGIVGKNGVGKSTLLRILSDTLEFDSGKVEVNGRVIPVLQMNSGFDLNLLGKDNIILACRIVGGVSKREARKLYPKIVKFAGIESSYLDMQMKYYSSGMIARMAFAIVMQLKADIFIFDEALLSVGDFEFQKTYTGELKKKLAKENSSAIIVSHNLPMLQKMCDRIIVLDKKRISFRGNPKKAIEFYQSKVG